MFIGLSDLSNAIVFRVSVFWGRNENIVKSFLLPGNILQKTCFLIMSDRNFSYESFKNDFQDPWLKKNLTIMIL